ncbi:TIGR02302 family protein [Methylocystis parvus]|uniref:TIGR02302 family protein n=1 Tax=Methylocystis parvus TaxID=134 RepID=A0A6B8M6E2_9HYPH|nr:TIGR02302 family protein [Methylocystis parvus]QGM96893.1 TIGR02302 family protein [Methylocystis parvus]WBJ99223.1 TIGR02302 family protein [Methylocystis parvus OBBP]
MDGHPENEPRGEAETPLDRALRHSARALLAERLLRLCAGLATLALFFLALSWLGLWRALPLEARMAGVAFFGFAALYLLGREIARGLPRRPAAAARLDAAASGPLKPAASLDDTLAAREAADPATAALWALHRKRLEAALTKTPVAPPQPRLPERDPYALRAFALVAAVAAAFVAGDEKRARLAAAFDWRTAPIFAPAHRVDAWFDPPAYTSRPPIVLAQESGAVEAPVNSTLRLRPADAAVSVEGALEPNENADKKERGFTLAGAARLFLPDGRAFDVTAIPDRAPSIALSGRPRNNARGSMTLSYRAEDDYGVVSAEAVFSKPGGRRALYDPPRMPLDPPAGASGLGEGRATLDLADSPYAGAKVEMRLVARDAAGNEGASEAVEATLPQRRFVKPLARALVEQRRILALDPEARANVRAALEALSLAPEAFETPSAVHLGLRAARRSLEGRRTDDELRGVADMLWSMALSLEDGDTSEAERDLRAAEQALREAMQRGASDEEIARRSQDLRAALDKFLEQLGARPRPPGAPREASGDPDSVTPEDLQGMLDDIEKAMKSGDMAQAQKLLDELQDIMENAQTGDESGARSAAEQQRRRDMQKALSDLDQLSREEQRLRDDTFQGMQDPSDDDDVRKPPRGGKRGQAQAQSNDDMNAERRRQQALRDRLEREQDALKGDAGEAGEELDDARKAMKEAEDAMKPGGEGRGKAVDAQGRAVEALRKGADKLAEQMRGGQEGEGEEGEDGARGRGKGRGRFGQGRDPLGRTQGGQRAGHEKYDPLGLPPAQRAHRVQEELRRRLGQPERPTEELDYLQRLLTR